MRFTGKTSLVAMALFATACAAAAEIQPDATTPQPKLAPVSWRLKGKLTHSSREKQPAGAGEIHIGGVRFSPDGKQLIASDESANSVINLWDVESHKRIRKFETDVGLLICDAFDVSHDWKTLLTPIWRPEDKPETVERGDQLFVRRSFDDSISVWKLQTGELFKELRPETTRRICSLEICPDGVHCVGREELSGEFVRGRRDRHRVSIWNCQTGEHRTLPQGVWLTVSSARGTLLAASVSDPGMPFCDQGIDLIENLDEPKLRRLVTFDPLTNGRPLALLAGDSLLVGFVTVDKSPADNSIVFWNTKTGEELWRLKNVLPSVVSPCKIGPDDQTAYALCDLAAGMKVLFLIDSTTQDVRRIDLGEMALCNMAAFHPSGKWIAAPVLSIPPGHKENDSSDSLPQPKILVIDVATGKILETLITPQCHPNSCAFSPDGKTLATSGNGEVQLWDFSVPPGQLRGK